jgi:citronellyl-CoA dehydrogenase
MLPRGLVAALDAADEPRRNFVTALGRQGFFADLLTGSGDADKPPIWPIDIPSFAALIEQLALTRHWGLTLGIALHAGVFLPMVARLAHPDRRNVLVQAAAAGEVLGTVAVTDADAAGSDFLGMGTTATFDGAVIRLSGEKTFITSATIAEYAVVFARWRPGRHFTNFCALLVPIQHPGVSCEPISMGVLRGAGIGRLRFDNVLLPAHALLGRREFGMRYFLEHVSTERLVAGVWAVAVAEQCLRETQRYAVERSIGAETLWHRSAVRQRFARALVDFVQLRALVDETIQSAGNGPLDSLRTTVIKAAVPELMERLIGTCLQLHGAQGLQSNGDLLQCLKEFRAFGIGGGSTETMLELVADLWPSSLPAGGEPWRG